MKILCTIITGAIKDLAKQLGRSESYTCNLVSVWQTKNQSAAYPTVNDLKALLEANKEEAWDTYFAIPNYDVIEYNVNEVPIKHDGNKVTLMKLPSNNSLEYFYNMYKHLPNLRNLVKTTEEAYRFSLWREMAFMQYGLDKKVENRPFTEGIALKKMEEWRKRHPVSIQTTQQPVQQNSSDVSANQNSSTDEVTVKSFGSELVNANNGTTNIKETVAKEEAEDVHKVPMIGTDVLQVNRDTPFAKLTREFTTIERRDRVEMLARRFSDIVDQAVQNKLTEIANAITKAKQEDNDDEVIRLYGKLALFNDSTLGRKAAIEEITLEEIFSTMKEEIEEYANMTEEEADEDYGEGQGAHIINAYQKILDNWEALLEETRPIIEKNENLKIIVNTHSFNTGTDVTEVVGGTVTDSTQDEDLDEDENNDDVEGKRVEGHEGWSYKARFIDPAKTLSKSVKKILNNLKREDANGQIEVDDLGNIRYLDAEFAHAALINELSDMILPNDFSRELEDGTYEFPALTKVAKKYPWANQIINALQADPTLISSFYADFRKDYIPYWGQIYDEAEGKWKCIQFNAPVALDSMRDAIIRNYDQGVKLDEDTIYNSVGKVMQDKATIGLNLTTDTLSLLDGFDADDSPKLISSMTKGLRMLGVNANDSTITSLLAQENAFVKIRRILNAMRNIFESAPKVEEGAHLIEALAEDYNIIAKQIGIVSELDNTSTFRANGKTYPSYSAPNYLDTMFKMFKSDKYRKEYLDREFGRYEWFKRNGKWRSEWLRLIESDESVRNHLELKEVNSIGGVEYTNWQPSDIKPAFIREYFSVGYNKGSKRQFAYYNMPIFSDSPVAKFIKFIRYTSDSQQSFKDKLLPLFTEVVKQEISRIKLVQDRRAKGVPEISNFDKNGGKFHFFPKLNKEEGFLERVITLTEEGNLKDLDALISTTINRIMQEDFREFLQTNLPEEGLKQDLLNEGSISSGEQFEDALEEYFWNQAYATTQIIELTTTDLAFYKDGTDFQKRYKEVYAAGTKLNTNSKYGRQIERTVYLEDQIVTSSSYADIKKSLDKAVELGHIQSFDRDNILNKFKDINVADAQAYRSLSSMRAVLDMMGAWTPDMEESMERIQNGKWNMKDFNTVWQTIKPFVFTQVEKPNGLGGIMKVPHQNKNSEFLLLAAYQVVATSMGKSAKLRALDKFMEKNNIDVIQFESAVKAGKEQPININYSSSKLDVWKMNNPKEWEKLTKHSKESKDIKIFKEGNDYLLNKGLITQEEYNSRFEEIEPNEQEVYDTLMENCFENGQINPNVVHELPYSDYVIQQPTPEHLFDHEAVFGSQFRNLIISDMPDNPDFRVKVNGIEFTKKEVMNLYQAIIVENLLEDWQKVKGKFKDIHSLQKALIDAVKSNAKYGSDMLSALQLVEVTNPTNNEKELVFNIPLDNPSTTSQIQELVTSMFKNAITKQKIKGASCILVSDFGLTNELHVLHGEQGEITGIECYLPAYSKKFYAPFAVTKKTADGEEYQELDVKKLPIELRKLIGYRIPTEDKYSMAPLIVKGFLPQQNGSAIMLPADITQIAGSDFDVRLLLMSK